MTKFGEKPSTKLTPVSKKKKAEATPEAVDWVVEDFAKVLQYFHDVIGFPGEGKIPKDITVEDVPLSKLEKHWGVKAKNDKNGYKKEGVKGILAEDIHKLVTALDRVDKFQLFSLEIANGLYYERILKKAVNWAACGVDKHKGQLAWRFRRNSPAQLEVPPWKRVEHKYTPPAGLVVTIDGEEQNLYPAKSREQCEPSEGRKASAIGSAELLDSNKSVKQSDGPGEGTKANDVAPFKELAGPEKIEELPNSPGKSQKAPGEGRNASDIAIEEPAGPEKIDELPNSPEKSDKATGEGRKASDIATDAICVASERMASDFAPKDSRLSTPLESSNHLIGLNEGLTTSEVALGEKFAREEEQYFPIESSNLYEDSENQYERPGEASDVQNQLKKSVSKLPCLVHLGTNSVYAATSEDCQIIEERSTPAKNYKPALIQMEARLKYIMTRIVHEQDFSHKGWTSISKKLNFYKSRMNRSTTFFLDEDIRDKNYWCPSSFPVPIMMDIHTPTT